MLGWTGHTHDENWLQLKYFCTGAVTWLCTFQSLCTPGAGAGQSPCSPSRAPLHKWEVVPVYRVLSLSTPVLWTGAERSLTTSGPSCGSNCRNLLGTVSVWGTSQVRRDNEQPDCIITGADVSVSSSLIHISHLGSQFTNLNCRYNWKESTYLKQAKTTCHLLGELEKYSHNVLESYPPRIAKKGLSGLSKALAK